MSAFWEMALDDALDAADVEPTLTAERQELRPEIERIEQGHRRML